MILSKTLHPKITNDHLAKFAYVYLRQSTPGQVLNNTESTTRQYALVERVIALGWPRERVRVIDEDLGKSGSSMTSRFGFQQIIVEVGLARVGLVVCLEANRLSRNNSDWYQLLDLCSIFGTLVADFEVIYDPRIYHDRMLLGLAGLMSEAELHQIKIRLQEGKRSKAARGELRVCLPVGLERQNTGEVILHPDEQIQACVRLVFSKFRELGSARAVTHYFYREGLKIPTRLVKGPEPYEISWGVATLSNVRNIIRNPAYAGAYVYGRRKVDPTRKRPGLRQSGLVIQSIDKWEICLKDIYPTYISWDEFIANQKRLTNNQNNYSKGRYGVTRNGQALLQGIVLCGLCGAHMRLYYDGLNSELPVYFCDEDNTEYGSNRCQQIQGWAVDKEVERLVIETLSPDRISLALLALEQLETEAKTLQHQWELRVERARIEATRAQRQYNTVEPENRLVARNLEKIWESKLRAVEEIERDFQVWSTKNHLTITDEDRQQILALGEDLPKLWSAATTTNADRKQIIRFIIKEVVVDKTHHKGKIWFKINWQTGATTEHLVKQHTVSYNQQADSEQLQKRARQLNKQGKSDSEIAVILTNEGYQTTRLGNINRSSVWRMRKIWGIRANRKYEAGGNNPLKWDDGTYSVQGIMAEFGIPRGTVYDWLRRGVLQGKQNTKIGVWKILLSNKQKEILCKKTRKT